MSVTNLVTPYFKILEANQIISAFSSNNMYAFASQFIPSNTTPVAVSNDYDSYFNDAHRNMIFGKLILDTNLKIMIKNYPWVSVTIYDEWNHKQDMRNKKFFVIVDNTTEYYCFKCLGSPGTPSTIKPVLADTSPSDDFYVTSDGYHWKYMFTIDNTTYNKFSTLNFVNR